MLVRTDCPSPVSTVLGRCIFIPANSLGILADLRHIIVLDLPARTGHNLQNDLVQRVGSKDIDVIAGVGPASRQGYLRVMG